MDTLILNGLQNSSEHHIVDFLAKQLHDMHKIVNLYSYDEIIYETAIDEYVKKCNAVVIVSPIIFGTLSGKIIDFAAKYIGLSGEFTHKYGAVIFTCDNGDSVYASETAQRILNCFNVREKFADVVIGRGKYENILLIADWLNSKAYNENIDKGTVTKFSSPQEKIKLFRSLFKGREDVYALRWQNAKMGKSGYSPVCSNKWVMANGVKFKVVTKKNNNAYNEKIEKLLNFHGIDHSLKNKLNSSFVVIDGRTVWYSADEIFNYNVESFVLRIEDEVLAGELICT